MFLYIYTFLGFYATRVYKKKNGKRKPRQKEGFCLSLKKLVSKYIIWHITKAADFII